MSLDCLMHSDTVSMGYWRATFGFPPRVVLVIQFHVEWSLWRRSLSECIGGVAANDNESLFCRDSPENFGSSLVQAGGICLAKCYCSLHSRRSIARRSSFLGAIIFEDVSPDEW